MYKTLIWCASALAGVTITVAVSNVNADPLPKPLVVVTTVPSATVAAISTETPVHLESSSVGDTKAEQSNTNVSNNTVIKQVATKYIYTAMVAWKPLNGHIVRKHDGHYEHDSRGLFITQNEAEVRARYETTAKQIVDVAYDDAITPLFTGDQGRLKTALQLAAIASFEGGFQKFVEDGDCNKPGFHSDGSGDCDGGGAFSNWQIHIWGGGYVIKDGDLTQVHYLPKDYLKDHPDTVVIKGMDLVDDPRIAALVAYYLVRYSTRNYHSLCQYTGENCEGTHPLATARSGRAVSYLRDHPFVMPSTEQIEQLKTAYLSLEP